MLTTRIAAAALSLALTGALFTASTGAQANTVLVHYSDLDLATSQGREALQQRLDAAALKVCREQRDLQGHKLGNTAWRACYLETRTKVDAKARTAIAAATQRAGDNAATQLGG